MIDLSINHYEVCGICHSAVCEHTRASASVTAAVARPSFDTIYMNLAVDLSRRSTCLRGTKVGCVITSADHRKVLAVGYNGNAHGLPNRCDRVGEEAVGNCGDIHAEMNAVVHCDAPYDDVKLVYCTHLPFMRKAVDTARRRQEGLLLERLPQARRIGSSGGGRHRI